MNHNWPRERRQIDIMVTLNGFKQTHIDRHACMETIIVPNTFLFLRTVFVIMQLVDAFSERVLTPAHGLMVPVDPVLGL